MVKLKSHDVIMNLHLTDIRKMFRQEGLGKGDILKVIAIPDVHVPLYDKKAVRAVLSFLDDYKPNNLIFIGDFWDLKCVSHWERNKSVKDLVRDVKDGRKLLEKFLSKTSGKSTSFFCMGNHEYWLDLYLDDCIPNVVDSMRELGYELDSSRILGLDDLGLTVIPYNEILKLGAAHFTHGFYCSKYHASKHVAVIGGNIYYGHVESVQTFTETTIRGLKEGSSIGTLRDFKGATFLRKKPVNWNHGFGIFEFRYDGTYTRYIPIIINGKFSYNGKIYK